MSEWIVKIEYKNEKMETVVEKEYDFKQYVEMLRQELMKDIVEIEDAFYDLSGNKQKHEWDENLTRRFKRIRHKLLDQANAIQRLPQNLTYKNHSPMEMSSAEFIDKLLKK